MSTVASRPDARRSVGTRDPADAFWIWPRGATLVALIVVVVTQLLVLFGLTERSFFFHDDFNYFQLAQERGFVHYLLTPILGVYPAPGDRLLSAALHRFAPLNFTVARVVLLVILAATTVLLWQLVRTLARTDRWWTVALVVPFAFSVTLVVPIAWWSAGIPIIPALLCTVIAVSAWLRAYTDPRPAFWIWIVVIAEAAAGAFYVKFLLIPVYLVLMRLLVLPELLGIPAGVRALWRERGRWIALIVPPAVFVAVYVLSGLAARSAVEGSRPYLDYITTAWFQAFVPAAFLNARAGTPTAAEIAWPVVVAGQVVLFAVVVATVRRSAVAGRAWLLLTIVFLVNIAAVGAVRIAALGVDEIAFALRYYPEVVLFLPLVLAMCARPTPERAPRAVRARTPAGGVAIGLIALGYLVGLVISGSSIVNDLPGVKAKVWYENLRGDLDVVSAGGAAPRIVDSETPSFVMEDWMAPADRISTVIQLLPLRVVFDELADHTYLVDDDGHLVEASFLPLETFVDGGVLEAGAHRVGSVRRDGSATCLDVGGTLALRPMERTGDPLGLRLHYAEASSDPVPVVVHVADPDRSERNLTLRPIADGSQLLDLGTNDPAEIVVGPTRGASLCIERMEIGILSAVGT